MEVAGRDIANQEFPSLLAIDRGGGVEHRGNGFKAHAVLPRSIYPSLGWHAVSALAWMLAVGRMAHVWPNDRPTKGWRRRCPTRRRRRCLLFAAAAPHKFRCRSRWPMQNYRPGHFLSASRQSSFRNPHIPQSARIP